MATAFSAGPQAVGYLHQARYALYALLRENQEEAAVVVEGLDDIEIQDDSGPVKLEQLKHHLGDSATLTNASPDLWKTLRIWASQVRSGTWTPGVVKLNLVTTATARKNTAAWYLKGEQNRNVEKAGDILVETMAKSRTKDQAMLDAFTQYRSLSDQEQHRLLDAITIIDGASSITDISSLIKQELKFAAPPTEKPQNILYEQLEGWWFSRVVEHLVKKSQAPITLMELRQKIWSITEQLREDNLPINYADAIPDSVVDPDTDERLFVRQLKCIDVKTDRIKKAIRNYYRAFEQRASWVRNELLIDDELMQYEQKLIEEWETYKLMLEDDVAADAKEEKLIETGRKILNWAEQDADIKIRPNVDAKFILRGSYHMLADTERPRVHWHPKFLERLEELLTP